MYHVSPVFMYLLYSCIRRINIVKETWFLSLGWEDPLEDGMTAQSSILAWKIPMDKSSLVGYSPWGHKELDTTEWLSTAHKWYHIIFVCFFLTYFTYYDHLWTHPCGCKWHFILYGLVIFHYTYEPHTHVYCVFSTHSPADGHFVFFHVLAIRNSAALNTEMQVIFQMKVFIFSGYMLRSGIWIMWQLFLVLVF